MKRPQFTLAFLLAAMSLLSGLGGFAVYVGQAIGYVELQAIPTEALDVLASVGLLTPLVVLVSLYFAVAVIVVILAIWPAQPARSFSGSSGDVRKALQPTSNSGKR